MENNLIICDYAHACREGRKNSRPPMLEKYLKPDSTHREILDYFFITHNLRAFQSDNFPHMMIPYLITAKTDGLVKTVLRQPFFELPQIFKRRTFTFEQIDYFNEILKRAPLKNLEVGGILLIHSYPIVDYLPDDSLIKKFGPLYQK